MLIRSSVPQHGPGSFGKTLRLCKDRRIDFSDGVGRREVNT